MISAQKLKKVLRPLVVIKLVSNEGVEKTIALTLDQFHNFRYQLSKCLSFVHRVENIMTLA